MVKNLYEYLIGTRGRDWLNAFIINTTGSCEGRRIYLYLYQKADWIWTCGDGALNRCDQVKRVQDTLRSLLQVPKTLQL